MSDQIVNWPESDYLPVVHLPLKGRVVASWGTRYSKHYRATVNGTEVFIGRRTEDTIWEIRLRRRNFQYLGDAAGFWGITEQIGEKTAEYALPMLTMDLP